MASNKFYSRSRVATTHYSPKCPTVIIHKDFSYDKDGHLIIVEKSRLDIDKYINESAKDCTLKAILNNLVKCNDTITLNSFKMTDEQAHDSRLLQKIDVNSLNEDLTRKVKQANGNLAALGLSGDDISSLTPERLNALIDKKINDIMAKRNIEINKKKVGE